MIESNRFGRRIVAAVAAGCIGLTLASVASAVDLRDWGRKLPTSERFVVLAQFNNQAVLDKETQLVWERSPNATLYNYSDALHIGCGRSSVGGRKGWRLPSDAELMSLLEPTTSSEGRVPAGHPFTFVNTTQFFWTTTRYANPAVADKWIAVNIAHGYSTAHAYSSQDHAWCVRGSQ